MNGDVVTLTCDDRTKEVGVYTAVVRSRAKCSWCRMRAEGAIGLARNGALL